MIPPYVTPQALARLIDSAFEEDLGTGANAGDHSSLAAVPAEAEGKARLLVKSDGILAGVTLAEIIFRHVGRIEVTTLLQDGSPIRRGDVAFIVQGNARAILQAERLVLNCMQRMSGIATQTHKAVQMVKGYKARILDTRKTTPNFRMIEKWATFIGGATNHRFGLYDMIMLKDNHIDYAGGITNAVKAALAYKQAKGLSIRIEVETRSLAEVEEALQVGGVDVIMLDNMDIPTMREAVQLIGNRCQTEASGGITLEELPQIAATGVDFISMGALTHSAKILDLSLKAC
ncbi:carboxylating nicotinate-nucleotide diphosphorylase [Rhodoflexus caldus]|uniref:carboxylating nicotinate-nucleotide diphosphorylase n=1 Tax=Rhodoflexus caldus TaxID=2891236 RepID=UPI00202A17AC|nr:carboxylating nicotinate-nucleotide diphosphorylase [Rhodoflexus caldus]